MLRSEALRLRPDLVIHTTLQRPGTYITAYTIFDPTNNKSYQLNEQEMFLCRNLSELSWESEIFSKFKRVFGLTLTIYDLDIFISQMKECRLLEPVQVMHPKWVKKIFAQPQEDSPILFQLHNPMEVIRPIAQIAVPMHGLFKLIGRFILMVCVPFSFIAIVRNFGLIRYDLIEFSNIFQLPLFVIAEVLVFGMCSRLAQGIALVCCGGRVGKAGIKLGFGFVPHAFLGMENLQFLSRPKQLWVLSTSLIIRAGFVALSAYLWLSTRELGTALMSISLFILVINSICLILTASPFWKSDGYVWLITYFRLPHLLERSTAVWEMLLFRPGKSLLDFKERLFFLILGVVEAVAITLLMIAAVTLYSYGLGESLSLFLGSNAVIFLLFCFFTALILRNLFSGLYQLRSL